MSEKQEEIVQRVLGGLRKVKTPFEMERRIVAVLAARTDEEAGAAAKVRLRRPRWRLVPVAVGAALPVLLCVLLLTHRPSSPDHIVRPPARPVPTEAGPVVKEAAPLARSSGVRRMARPGARDALREPNKLAAVSFPAPPMPLTEQEKLLVRLAHRSDPVQLAMLDPQQRDRRNAAEKTQFQQFFEPPTSGDPQ